MASKFNTRKTGPNSPSTSFASDTFPQSCHAQIPPPLSGSSSLLASSIRLPTNFCIAYAVFVPQTDSSSNQTHTDLEHARLSIFSQYSNTSFLNRLFPFVSLNKESHSLWMFSFGDSTDSNDHAQLKLQNLTFDRLTCKLFHCFIFEICVVEVVE